MTLYWANPLKYTLSITTMVHGSYKVHEGIIGIIYLRGYVKIGFSPFELVFGHSVGGPFDRKMAL